MAHKGKVYPVAQTWRLYSGNVNDTVGLPPEVMRFRTDFWKMPSSAVTSDIFIDCERMPWTPGADEIGYQSNPFVVAAMTVRVGVIGVLSFPMGKMLWKYAVWADGVDQIPWGWLDQIDHYAWHPGDTKLIVTDPGFGALIWPYGVTSVRGKTWAEF